MNVKNGHPAPGPRPCPSQATVLRGCSLSSEWGSALPRSQEERSRTHTHRGQACIHSPTARVAVLTGCPHWPPRSPSSPLPWRETKTLREIHHLQLEVPGPLEEPQPRTEGGHAPSLEQVPFGGQQAGQGLGICLLRGMEGAAQPPLTTDSLRSSLLHRPAEPRTLEGAGVSTSQAERLGPCQGARQGRNGGTTPTTAQTRGGEELRPASSRKKPQPAWRESKSVSPGRGRGCLCARLFQSLVFFSLNGGSW